MPIAPILSPIAFSELLTSLAIAETIMTVIFTLEVSILQVPNPIGGIMLMGMTAAAGVSGCGSPKLLVQERWYRTKQKATSRSAPKARKRAVTAMILLFFNLGLMLDWNLELGALGDVNYHFILV